MVAKLLHLIGSERTIRNFVKKVALALELTTIKFLKRSFVIPPTGVQKLEKGSGQPGFFLLLDNERCDREFATSVLKSPRQKVVSDLKC